MAFSWLGESDDKRMGKVMLGVDAASFAMAVFATSTKPVGIMAS